MTGRTSDKMKNWYFETMDAILDQLGKKIKRSFTDGGGEMYFITERDLSRMEHYVCLLCVVSYLVLVVGVVVVVVVVYVSFVVVVIVVVVYVYFVVVYVFCCCCCCCLCFFCCCRCC
jgi:hypothetical protein